MADKNYFRLTSLEDGNELGIANSVDDISQITLEYSTDDGSTWNNYTVGDVIRLDMNGFVLFRGDNATFSKSSSDYHHIFASKNFNASGNIMSLLDKSCELMSLTGKNSVFNRLFYNITTLIDASELILPATTLVSACYQSMFQGCTSLTSAPELPATTTAASCCYNMFYGCTSLISAPSILPAISLTGWSCYEGMFQGCTSLTTAPVLPATTLSGSCYRNMFNGCTLLNKIEVSFIKWGSLLENFGWVTGVSSTGTFICPEELPETRGNNYIPNGWTIEHPSPSQSGFKNFAINGRSVKTLFLNGKEIYIAEY